MTKTEILVLIITIFVSVSVLSLFLDKVFKSKKEKPKEEKKEQLKETKEESTEEKPKEKEKKYKAPEISIALQDELNEFKDYLKTRITPETVSQDERIKNSYDLTKFNSNYKDFNFPSRFDDEDDDEFPFRKRQKQSTTYEDLPDDVKILLFTNFFDTKF